jgi:gliding motility-associated lipoprotein GldH
MMNKAKRVQIKTTVLYTLCLCMIVFLIPGCGKKESIELYHRFPDKSWARFNLLSFEIPVKNVTSYNIYLFARFEPCFQYETLDFNMIMNTPGGEERINEYQMEVKSRSGDFSIECNKDSCMGTIMLKKEIYISKPGVLKIEIENLTPRITTECILGAGIRLVPSGK